MNDIHLTEIDEAMPNLLNTIKIPKNLHYLTDSLPKPNYAPLKTRRIEKAKFVQTLANNYPPDYNDSGESNTNAVLPKI